MDIEANIESEFYNDEFEMDYKDNIKFEVASNRSLLPGPSLAEHHVLEDTVSMTEFNIIRFSIPGKPASTTIDQRF